MTYGTISWGDTTFTLLDPMFEGDKIRIEVEVGGKVKVIKRRVYFSTFSADLYFIYKNYAFFKMEFLEAQNESY